MLRDGWAQCGFPTFLRLAESDDYILLAARREFAIMRGAYVRIDRKGTDCRKALGL